MEGCVYQAVQEMINKMKEEIAKTQNIQYPEQIKVAEIYNVVAKTLAVACRKASEKKPDNCMAPDELEADVNMDCFILLSRLKEDGFISEEYEKKIFDALLKMKPELKETVESDRAKGLI